MELVLTGAHQKTVLVRYLLDVDIRLNTHACGAAFRFQHADDLLG
jgi:hypothetical protein